MPGKKKKRATKSTETPPPPPSDEPENEKVYDTQQTKSSDTGNDAGVPSATNTDVAGVNNVRK